MKVNKLTPILWTEKLQETIDFYTDKLGFVCEEHNNEWGWASLSTGDISIMLAKPNEHNAFEKPMFTGSFYFNIDQVDELWTSLHDKVSIIYPPEVFEWGMKEFAIYDNNGYLLQFGENIIE